MAQHIATGIDIGSHHIRIVVGEHAQKGTAHQKRILGTATVRSQGIRNGNIANPDEVRQALLEATQQAERVIGSRLRSAYLAVGGTSLSGMVVHGGISVSRADAEITELDVDKVIKAAEQALPEGMRKNKRMLHTVPISFTIDGELIPGDPVGLKGLKLEADVFFTSALARHVEALVEIVESCGIDIEDVVASPLAAGIVNLTKAQRVAGVVLANIGAETTSTVVYENNVPLSINVFPIGSDALTNDFALKLKISLEEAEELKQHYENQMSFSKKKIDDIATAHFKTITGDVGEQLKAIDRDKLLPAGIVITGGGAHVPVAADAAQSALDLPARTATISIGGIKDIVKDPVWSVAYGLCVLGLSTPNETGPSFDSLKRGAGTVTHWFKQLLP